MSTKLACTMLLCLMTVGAYSQGSAFSINVPVDKLFDSIVSAIKSLSETIRDDSVGVLARDLSTLAGQEKGLALNLKSWQARDGSIRNSGTIDRVKILDESLSEIKATYLQIRQHINNLDPKWSRNNTAVIADIGGFAHDGIIFYCAPGTDCRNSPGGNGGVVTGKESVVFAQAEQANDFISKLEDDARQLANLADKLASSAASSRY